LPARNSRRIGLAAGLLSALLLAPAAPAAPALAQTSLLNLPAPQFVRTSLTGQPINLRAYRGKVVLLNFWATWCAPCEIEMPHFVDWQNRYGPRGLQILGVTMDDDPALARTASRKLKINYPIAIGDAKLGELYGGVLGLPVTFLIDPQGKIRTRFEGETDLKTIETQLVSLLPRLSTP
jgi:cytochrome c biogenesis protein CcmG, thiol:disulfide interchange protein DsbE